MYKIQSLLAVVFKSSLCINVINCLTFKGHLFKAVNKILIWPLICHHFGNWLDFKGHYVSYKLDDTWGEKVPYCIPSYTISKSYTSFLSVFTVHIFVHIIVSIFISSPATKLYIKWLDLHTLSITIYISWYHHIFTTVLPWTHSKFCVHFKLYCLHFIHGHLSLKIHLISSYSPTKLITPSLPSGLVRK